MNEPVESVLQKSREEFEKCAVDKGYSSFDFNRGDLQAGWLFWQASRSALEPMLAERVRDRLLLEAEKVCRGCLTVGWPTNDQHGILWHSHENKEVWPEATRCTAEAIWTARTYEHDADKIDELSDKLEAAEQAFREAHQLIKDYKEANDDKKRLVRELDVAMNGKEGAAQQASLCDLIGPAEDMRAENEKLRELLRLAVETIQESAPDSSLKRPSHYWIKRERLMEKAQQALSPSPTPAQPAMLTFCSKCGRPYGEHAREALNIPNEHGWKWTEAACPVGGEPFHPTQTFAAKPSPDSATPAQEGSCSYHGVSLANGKCQQCMDWQADAEGFARG